MFYLLIVQSLIIDIIQQVYIIFFLNRPSTVTHICSQMSHFVGKQREDLNNVWSRRVTPARLQGNDILMSYVFLQYYYIY